MHLPTVVAWSVLLFVVLVVASLFTVGVVSGEITLPGQDHVATSDGAAGPVIDPSYPVLVLNATPEAGLGESLRQQLIAAGWAEGNVFAGDAASTDFEKTTVYYTAEADESAAQGVADVIGGAALVHSDAYAPADDTTTADVDESQSKQLAVVIGADQGQ